MNPTKADLAYLAGYFDGEGCITVEGGLRLLVTATHPGACVSLQQAFGGVLRPRKAPHDCKKQFQWTVYGVAAYRALGLLKPHLKEKRVQAILARTWFACGKADADLLSRLAVSIKYQKHCSWSLRGSGDVVRSKDGDTDATIR